jgi:thiamine-phosphate pyrophosphorylase
MLPAPRLLFIADVETARGDVTPFIKAALRGGCRWILLRDLHAGLGDLIRKAKDIKTITDSYGAKLFISRHAEAALEVDAAGAHLSATMPVKAVRHLLPGKTIGLSCHTMDELRRAVEDGADYASLSPVFESPSKPGYGPALGIDGLRQACKSFPLPILALGGLTPQKTAPCLAAGASGVAVMGDVLRCRDPEERVREYLGQMG